MPGFAFIVPSVVCANKESGRFLHRGQPLANIYVNNQKVLLESTSEGKTDGITDVWIASEICCRYLYHRYIHSKSGRYI